MCSICGGSACGGSGMCTAVARYTFNAAHIFFGILAVAIPTQIFLFYRKCKQWFYYDKESKT